MICKACIAAWTKPERLDLYRIQEKGVLVHDSFSKLQQSHDDGCALCVMLLGKLHEEVDNDTNKFGRKLLTESGFFNLFIGIRSTAMQTNHHSGSSLLQARVELKSKYGKRNYQLYKPSHDRRSIDVCIDRATNSRTLAGRINGRLIAEDPASPEVVKLIKLWIEECNVEHEVCKVDFAQRKLPSRTINVGPSDGSQDPRLETHEDSIKDASMQWIALSHRWGDGVPLKTMRSNLHEYLDKIPFEQLPATFRDAVVFTRKLGVRHLWIDSLCIIQDDAEDWNAEYPNMGSIYECSYITLIADIAADCDAGFLQKRSVERLVSIPWLQDEADSPIIYLAKGLRPWNRALNDKHSHIYTRGWCLQEDLLSPRSLHFGPNQIFFECRTHRRAESLARPLHSCTDLNLTAGKSFVRTNSGLTTTKHKRLTDDPDLMVYAEWAVVVNNYTRRSLTFANDKLPALVGAAQAFQRRLSTALNGYHAGVWENNLHKDLLWRARFGDTLIALGSRAPSWSWASVDGVVVFPRHLGPAFDGYLAEFHRNEDWPFAAPAHIAQHQFHPLRVTSHCIDALAFESKSTELAKGYGDNGLVLSSVVDEKLQTTSIYFDMRNEETEELKHTLQGVKLMVISNFSEGQSRMQTVGLLLHRQQSGGYRRAGTMRMDWFLDDHGGDAARRGTEKALRGWAKQTVTIY